MANGEVADCEAGTSLPVPPAFDQCSQASIEDGDEAAASAGEADLEDPLVIEQEELFGPAELDPSFGSEEGIASGSEAPVGPLESMLSRGAPARERDSSQLSPRGSQILDSMITQAMLSASLADNLALPWESGIMSAVFSDDPIVPMPVEVRVTHHLDPAAPTGGVGHDDVAGSPPKRPRLTTSTLRRYERVISFGNTLTDPEIDEARWNRALGKLYAIMVSCPAGTPPGVDFKDKNIDPCLRQIRLLCGSRSPNTVAKRANSLAKYCLWHRGFYYRRRPIPICAEEVSEYVWEKHQDGVTLSALTGFIEAAHFAVHVLGLPLKSPNKPLVTAFTKGVLDKTSINKPEKRQASQVRFNSVPEKVPAWCGQV